MRRIAVALGALATLGTVAVAISPSAYAANRPLDINDQIYNNPSGCYNTPNPDLAVVNATNQAANIYYIPDCKGPVKSTVSPERSYEGPGHSVSIR